MRTVYPGKLVRNFAFLLVFFSLFAFTTGLFASGDDVVRVKDDYRIKRTPDGTVSLYTVNPKGEKEEYVFTEFNADVLLLVYRKVDINNIVSSMAKKYYLSKTEARRSVKMTINELESRDLIVRL
jgi:hypothetical protein